MRNSRVAGSTSVSPLSGVALTTLGAAALAVFKSARRTKTPRRARCMIALPLDSQPSHIGSLRRCEADKRHADEQAEHRVAAPQRQAGLRVQQMVEPEP